MTSNSVSRQANIGDKMMKGRILKKLRFVASISAMKQGLASQFNSNVKVSTQNSRIPHVHIDEGINKINFQEAVSENSSVSEQITCTLKDDSDMEHGVHCKGKTTLPLVSSDNKVPAMLNYEPAASSEVNMISEECPSLSDFDDKCPPGGNSSVVFYTTSLRSIRKTFEDCQAIRFLLQSFKVVFEERDVSMHMEFRDELWKILGGRVIPPKLFIKGKYIGGADEVIGLHEQGKLKKLLDGTPLTTSNNPCTCCGSFHFVVCYNCNGSRKVFAGSDYDRMYFRCNECNENGLVKCPVCSS